MNGEIGALVAQGRDGAVYDAGPGLVVRKTFDGRSIASEARVMEYLDAQGYPVPRIHDVRAGGTEIVMERLVGPSQLDVISARPHTMPRHATLLADLHDRLHAIRAPDWLPVLDDDGDRVLHLDLHPLNVMLTDRGPVVIDWPNAARGQPLTDVAMTYVLLTCPEIPGSAFTRALLERVRVLVARIFMQRYAGSALDEAIAFAGQLKELDANMSPTEVARIQRLVQKKRKG